MINKKHLFLTIKNKLVKNEVALIEGVLNSHGLDFDSNWLRLLLRCLGHDLRETIYQAVKNQGNSINHGDPNINTEEGINDSEEDNIGSTTNKPDESDIEFE